MYYYSEEYGVYEGDMQEGDREATPEEIEAALTPPEPTEEWVDKMPFVQAVTLLIPEEDRMRYASDWRVIAGIAMLPGDRVNLLDPLVPMFAETVGLTVDQIRIKMQELGGVE